MTKLILQISMTNAYLRNIFWQCVYRWHLWYWQEFYIADKILASDKRFYLADKNKFYFWQRAPCAYSKIEINNGMILSIQQKIYIPEITDWLVKKAQPYTAETTDWWCEWVLEWQEIPRNAEITDWWNWKQNKEINLIVLLQDSGIWWRICSLRPAALYNSISAGSARRSQPSRCSTNSPEHAPA